MTDSFIGIDPDSATTFTMDSSLAVAEQGQIVAFKKFVKTTYGINDSGIRVTVGLESVTSSSDLWLRFEVKDYGYRLGSTWALQLPLNNFEEGFNPNEYEVYKDGSSFGVVHIEPDATDGSLIANITGFEISDSVAHDFEDINDLRLWESHTGNEATGTFGFTLPMHRALDDDYDQAYLNITNVAISSFSGDAPPVPSAVTGLSASLAHYDEVFVNWLHDLLNVTGFVIERDDG